MPRAFLKARDPFSCYSHFVGAVLSVSGLLILLLRLLFDPDISGQLAGAAVVFCLSLIALYSASSVYHFSLRGEAVLRRLKKLDHSMIYVLIAGSYTPIILKFMPAPRSFLFLGVIWLIALTGIAVKLLWIDAPRLIGTALFIWHSAGPSLSISVSYFPCPPPPLRCLQPAVLPTRPAASFTSRSGRISAPFSAFTSCFTCSLSSAASAII